MSFLKKNFLTSLLLLSFLLIGKTVYASDSNPLDPNIVQAELLYSQAVKTEELISINAQQLQSLIDDKEDFILYMGRPTCPYCRAFLPNLIRALKESKTKIYYIDSEKYAGASLQAFRDKYQLSTVPNLTVYHNQEQIARLTNASQSSVSTIKNFLKDYSN
ncbi:thioredoxin [Streptococcus loxodontisalivarius]|uniref:Bacteriocin transport accessory protein n=1 Tax=Streptococcus loxodontisalivarius TaxID=1349415 RepID=A0ABS2PU82_9STRE|nr:thioredoxin [Streptococcus loxodontisalivarius]MBM7643607.1 putative bacteriocin transport accessory protein [Streptococcus loxodontisalivarius]